MVGWTPGQRRAMVVQTAISFLSLSLQLQFDYKRNTNEKKCLSPHHVVVWSASATSAAALSPEWMAPSM